MTPSLGLPPKTASLPNPNSVLQQSTLSEFSVHRAARLFQTEGDISLHDVRPPAKTVNLTGFSNGCPREMKK